MATFWQHAMEPGIGNKGKKSHAGVFLILRSTVYVHPFNDKLLKSAVALCVVVKFEIVPSASEMPNAKRFYKKNHQTKSKQYS
jgi:hypothetical protein